ncbi:hypothetical protein FOMPIDRAFT_1056585 [Fomitopsis schrenkii]|uniref:Uncharacterized protein n=1 Tax=Fomitopsis schrenkii TaxID=2126942 RepID=S8ESQ9_FOMSC|nr:hypothetical protein FOMPIDRAFT_1056585 [Fomitopsis schrenkii]
MSVPCTDIKVIDSSSGTGRAAATLKSLWVATKDLAKSARLLVATAPNGASQTSPPDGSAVENYVNRAITSAIPVLSKLGISHDAIIGCLIPVTRSCDADTDDEDSDDRTCFALSWDMKLNESATLGMLSRDMTPASAFSYRSMRDSLGWYMLEHGGQYKGTLQVILVKSVAAVNRSGLMLLKVYGNEDENRNSEGAVEHLEWCGDCEHWEVVKEAPRLFRRRSV